MPPARRNTSRESLAATTSDRVRVIIEAAESSAAEIRAEAEAEAERIRAGAEERASALRSEVQSDVRGLIGSIREGVDRLRADLESLEQRLGERPAGETPVERRVRAAAPPAAASAEGDPDIALAEDAAVGLDAPEASGGDAEAARLVALNMALDGASREDVAEYLRSHHRVADPAPLLDDVFASVE